MDETTHLTVNRIHWWQGVVFFGVAALVQVILYLLIALFIGIGLFGGSTDEIMARLFSPPAIAVQLLITASVLIALSIGVPKLLRVPPSSFLHLGGAKLQSFLAAALGVVGIGVLVDELLFALHTSAPNWFSSGGLERFNRIFADASPSQFIWLTLIVAAAPGVSEELFFRGFILRAFRNGMSRGLAVILSALLFGLMHFDSLQSPGAMAIGIYLGYVALLTGSVWPGVLAHALNNFICSCVARYAPGGGTQIWSEGHHWLVLLGACALSAGAVSVLIRFSKRP